MSTAAPSAPSPSAPSAQPAPVAAPGPDAPGGPAATPAPAADSQPRLVKPAKPIPSLPGVFPDDDPFPPPPPPSSADAASDRARPGSQLQRGPDGRFVAASSPATAADGEHTPQPGDQPPPQPAKFKFAGEEFDSREAAEQNLRSLRGQYKPLQGLARSLGGIDKIAPTLTSAAESARAWKAEADRLRAELDGRQPAAAPAASDPAPADEPAESIDWELYAEIRKVAIEQGTPEKAEQWLHEQQERVINARVQALLDDRLAPLADAEQQAALASQTQALFTDLSTYVNGDGSVAYPELHDEQASYAIGRMWASLGLPPEAALTPQGAIAAIAIYRMAKGGRSQANPAAPTPASVAPPAPPAPTDAHAAADLGDGRTRELIAPGGQGPSAEAARVLAGLRSVSQSNRAVLGFEP